MISDATDSTGGLPDGSVADAVPELSQNLAQAVSRIYRRFRSEREMGEVGDAASSVLHTLYRTGSHTLKDLSEAERVTPGSMSQTVNRLVDLGLVTRASDPTDGRRVLFNLTTEGVELAASARARRYQWLNSELAARTPEELAVLRSAGQILREIADS